MAECERGPPLFIIIAREFVAKFGVADRFKTIDGDFHTTDFGAATYDFAIYSHVAHQESPSDNIAIFRRLRKALKPGGTLVVNDFVLNDDRTGHPFAMLFASQMLVATKEGSTYRQSDYRMWLSEAGFASVEITFPRRRPPPSSWRNSGSTRNQKLTDTMRGRYAMHSEKTLLPRGGWFLLGLNFQLASHGGGDHSEFLRHMGAQLALFLNRRLQDPPDCQQKGGMPEADLVSTPAMEYIFPA